MARSGSFHVEETLNRSCFRKGPRQGRKDQEKDEEKEGNFADRIQEAALACVHAFSEATLLNYLVTGLLLTTPYGVSECTLQQRKAEDFPAVRRMAISTGETYRAHAAALGNQKARSSPKTMLMGPLLD